MSRKHKSKEKVKLAKHQHKLLDLNSEAFQTKFDEVIPVKDLSYLDKKRPQKPNQKNKVIADLTPEVEEKSSYALLMESFGGEEKDEKSKKRNREGTDTESGEKQEKKKKKKKKVKIEEETKIDEAWEKDKSRLIKEIEKSQAEQKALFEESEEDEDESESEEEVFKVKIDFNKDVNYKLYSAHFNTPLNGMMQSQEPRKERTNEEIHIELIQPWTRFVNKEIEKQPQIKLKSFDDLKKSNLAMTDFQAQLFPIISTYQDLYYANQKYQQATEIRSLYVLHAMSTILTANDIQQTNNRKAGKKKYESREFRDQGFTKPRVLIIVPTRNSCLLVIEQLIKLMPELTEKKKVINNKQKCYEEFFEATELSEHDVRKPMDWIESFKGNNDDNFKIGVSLERKKLDLFKNFYQSDIIIASPLGLRLAIENKEGEIDFLSSIEVTIVDQVECFLMQNWDHMKYVFVKLNELPVTIKADISRLRMVNVDGKAKTIRQTIFFGSIHHPDVNNLLNVHCGNFEGKIKCLSNYGTGSIAKVIPNINQYFQRFTCNSLAELSDARFTYFTEQVFPQIISEMEKGVLLYIPSYFDFVRVRNFLRQKQKAHVLTFTQCCEYTTRANCDRARFYFKEEQRDWLVVTERFHYFYRLPTRGIKKMIFYGLPSFPEYYNEILNCVQSYCTSISLFCKYDLYQLEAVVGSKLCNRLMTSEKVTHFFQ